MMTLSTSCSLWLLLLASIILHGDNVVVMGFSFPHNNNNNERPLLDGVAPSSRRTFFSTVATTASTIAVGLTGAPLPSSAVTGANKVNALLRGYGLPTLARIPDGMTPFLDIYGKSGDRFPLLVQFCYPVTWVLSLPSTTVNGEDGTMQAGDYAKGDTATLYLYNEPGNIKDIANQPKDFYEKAVIKAISQKGDNMYQSFKITKVAPQSIDGQDYVYVDFKYELLTGAGFEVDRRGVAALTSEGQAVEVFWAASTRQRYKKTEPVLRDIVSTFRCNADGITLSDQLV